jgi:mannose-P-dolichol utilization defect protein 1
MSLLNLLLLAITVFMYAAGSTARIFTTIQEVDDMLILSGFVLATVLNYVLLLQMGLYWNVKSKKE